MLPSVVYQMLPYVILFTFASLSASDNIPKADEIRTLIKDVWDTRIAKLRVSADSFVRQQEAHAKVGAVGAGRGGGTPPLSRFYIFSNQTLLNQPSRFSLAF